ncbi:MAG: hypothetical protein DRI23_12750 [Candidatus Cloacimonadota bacterium]|nr:MAG: hypothetical protein DRI23_12750 [Candidatus Cloacimonadota bacterium]
MDKKKKLLPIPIGYDAYTMWDKWAQLRVGLRAIMRSTRDRSGGNELVCGNHFLYQENPEFSVVADIEGPGIMYFWRTNFWHGSPWHYEIDGKDNLVEETATSQRMEAHTYRWDKDIPPHKFIPEKQFPEPLALTWTKNHGADLNWVPVPFEKSFRMAYSKTNYGTGYGIFHKFLPEIELSQPLKSFDWNAEPKQEVIDLFNSAGADIAPSNIPELTGEVDLLPNYPTEIANIANTKGQIRAIKFSVDKQDAVNLGSSWLKITWDDRKIASIDCPVAMFFGAANLYNRDDREFLVKSIPVSIKFTEINCELSCYFPMPFSSSVKIELISRSSQPIKNVKYSIRYEESDVIDSSAYFHATYADFLQPEKGKDLVFLDTKYVEGGGDWTGHFVGTTFIFTKQNYLRTLEGIQRFFFDDAEHPHGYGTGSEEWGGGGDYWGGHNTTLPLAGHPCGHNKPPKILNHKKKETENYQNPLDLVHSAYRFLLADLMPFGKNARIQFEHGAENETNEHYESVTYWYGTPTASLILTDELDIGNEVSEKEHLYSVKSASNVSEVESRYEWGVDHLDGDEIYPSHTELERHHTGESQFTLQINSENIGVMLRRKFDYLYPNQRAEVFVKKETKWISQGFWYSPGSNTCVLAQPKTNKWQAEAEEEPPVNEERTVNRRFYESEFYIGKSFTKGLNKIEIKIVFAPKEKELWKGHPFPEKSAWSEIRYSAYSYIEPVCED